MSATEATDTSRAVERCRPADVTPVAVHAADLDSVAPTYLRDVKRELDAEGLAPVDLTIDACFDEDCPLATQDEIDRVREYVEAAAFLGTGAVTVRCEAIDDEAIVRPALEACVERARREGLTVDVEGPISV